MSSDIRELAAIQVQASPARRESPYIEAWAAKTIEDTVRQLIETRYLYQKLEVDWCLVEKYLAGSNFNWPANHNPNGILRTNHIEIQKWEQDRPAHNKRLIAEINSRTWILKTRHLGDDRMAPEIVSAAVGESHPKARAPVYFFAPAVQLNCITCKRASTFAAHVSSTRFSGDALHPRLIAGSGLEQVYIPVYRCEVCRMSVFTVLVRRAGTKLHLCGFAPRRPHLPSRIVPESVATILHDAEQAVAEGDVFASFYHLRTLLEHFLKLRLGLAMSDKMTGDEVIERHFGSLPQPWRPVLPNITDTFSTLSENLHARKGTAEDFVALRNQICDHIDMLLLLEKQSTSSMNPPPPKATVVPAAPLPPAPTGSPPP